MLASETARLVLSYLHELEYAETREKFMSECSGIAELRSLGPKELKYACRVNNRTLTDLLKEYIRYYQKFYMCTEIIHNFVFSLETQIRELAEEISTEDDEDLKFDRPLRILKVIRGLLKKRDSVNKKKCAAETKETSTQTQVEASRISTTSENVFTQTDNVSPRRNGSGPPRSGNGDKAPFFHSNIRIIPNVRSGFVPILPRSPAKRPAPAPLQEGEATTPENQPDKNVKKSKPQQNNSPDDREQSNVAQEFDEIELVDVGKKIATAIPADGVNSTNISAIADKYLDDEDLFYNLLEAYSSLKNPNAENESDEEMNTPVTSPLGPDDLGQGESDEQNLVEPSSMDEGEIEQNIEEPDPENGGDTHVNESKEHKSSEEAKKDAERLDTLAQLVQSTINDVTENYDEDTAPIKIRTESVVSQAQLKEPRGSKRPSKKLERQKDSDGQLNSFQRQLRGIIGKSGAVNHTISDRNPVPQCNPEPVEKNPIMSKFTSLCNEKISLPSEHITEQNSKPKEEEKQASVTEGIKITNLSSNSNPEPLEENLMSKFAFLSNEKMNIPPESEKVSKPKKQASVTGSSDINSKVQIPKVKPSMMKPAKRQRCKKCSACLSEPCGDCAPCRDKPSNGGKGKLKKRCM